MWMTHQHQPGDEIALFFLCRQFNRHAMIYTTKELWTTLMHDVKDSSSILESKCDIVLLYSNKTGVYHLSTNIDKDISQENLKESAFKKKTTRSTVRIQCILRENIKKSTE